MNNNVMQILTVIYLCSTICLVNTRQTHQNQIGSNKDNKNNKISYNRCTSDKVCVHGICSVRTHRCVCYQGWTGDVCDKLNKGHVFSPSLYSNQMRSKMTRKTKVTTEKEPIIPTMADRYVAELLTSFFPKLRDYFQSIFTKNALKTPTAKLSSMSKLSVRTVNEPVTMPKNSAVSTVKDITSANRMDTFSGNNLEKGKDATYGIPVTRTKSGRRQVKPNHIDYSTNNVIVSESRVMPSQSGPQKPVGRTRPRSFNPVDINLLTSNELSLDINMPSGSVSTLDVHPAREHVVSLEEASEESETSDDVCKDNYKTRPLSERMCISGLVCKYGKCSSDNKGSYIAFECACDQGAMGMLCDTKCCLDCGGNGRCDIYYDGSEYCKCRRGYYGPLCEHSDSEVRFANPHISPLIDLHKAFSSLAR
ncbi:hypothetical protein ACF0H5_004055 [Mactra antiquata]